MCCFSLALFLFPTLTCGAFVFSVASAPPPPSSSSPPACHQPTASHQLSSTNCYQPVATDQLPPTNCHPPIVNNKLPPTNCRQQISINQLSPTNCYPPTVWDLRLRRSDLRGRRSTLVFSRGSDVRPGAALASLGLRRCAAVICVAGAANCHQPIVTNPLPPTNCHQPTNCPLLCLVKLLTCAAPFPLR